MPDARVLALLRRTRALTGPPADTVPDADLLARFLDRGEEVAFEALVRRHGPMVRAVCRAALPNPADADDAFQATFLVLVRRAAVIRDRGAVGGWLYRVAYRAARKLRRAGPGIGSLPADLPAREAPGESFDVRRAVEEEIGRLPEKYRLPVQLCYVAGHTTTEAARHLGWARGTVLTRLAWARKRLRARLRGRGIAPAVGAVAAFVGRPAARGVGPELVSSTVRAAVALAARGGLAGLVTNQTVTITEGVARAMALNNLKWAAGVLLVAVALTGIGVNRWVPGTATADPGDKKRGAGKATPADELVAAGEAKPGPARAAVEAEPAPVEKSRGTPFSVAKPVGTWVREIDQDTKIVLRIDEDRIYAAAEFVEGNEKVAVAIDGDYSINKESVLFGVITGVECTPGSPGFSRTCVGQPFAFGFRTDGELLGVKDVRFAALGRADGTNQLDAVLDAIAGRYVADKVTPLPQRPKPTKFATPRPRRQYTLPPQDLTTPVPGALARPSAPTPANRIPDLTPPLAPDATPAPGSGPAPEPRPDVKVPSLSGPASAPTAFPPPAPAPESTPGPDPLTAPRSIPIPAADPEPSPLPAPTPIPDRRSRLTPRPAPTPESAPPTLEPPTSSIPAPVPTPTPLPRSKPAPRPAPTPAPSPAPASEAEPSPLPVPEPAPARRSKPAPRPAPTPAPVPPTLEPTTGGVPAPTREPAPGPEPAPDLEPIPPPVPTPTPVSESRPTPQATPTPSSIPPISEPTKDSIPN